MNASDILRGGVSTVRFHTPDLPAAKAWYADLLGMPPYFDQPAYAEFRLGAGQQELGLLDEHRRDELGGGAAPTGAVVYWHVDDMAASLARLAALGAWLLEPPRTFGGGYTAAAVTDPFGNILGLMRNPHLAGRR